MVLGGLDGFGEKWIEMKVYLEVEFGSIEWSIECGDEREKGVKNGF